MRALAVAAASRPVGRPRRGRAASGRPPSLWLLVDLASAPQAVRWRGRWPWQASARLALEQNGRSASSTSTPHALTLSSLFLSPPPPQVNIPKTKKAFCKGKACGKHQPHKGANEVMGEKAGTGHHQPSPRLSLHPCPPAPLCSLTFSPPPLFCFHQSPRSHPVQDGQGLPVRAG